MKGLVCAGKRMHETLLQRDNEGVANIERKYLEECQVMPTGIKAKRSLVPSPTPSFSSLAVPVPYCKRRKAGRGTGYEAISCVYVYACVGGRFTTSNSSIIEELLVVNRPP